ncbi:hypothetical protein LUZ62_032690 [Rhynchospora pubera]|uniref:GH10 domain-containing protein n=1 Tax=Rhynchospora pubera TaxID=906938 RepID=A0AAV8DMC8_9POAL|nr:hypothetical protein LUZ62_077786 [Rhynchospora pubera]KAJ4820124.1 hypothetical protein LUZ62_032690 [Rhynchospora pubera]
MMAPWEKAVLFLLITVLGGQAVIVNAVPYDYSATTECLGEPLKPQYGGGIIVNPAFDESLDGWGSYDTAHVIHKVSKSGNMFSAARERSAPHHSISQKVMLEKDTHYILSAWLQVDEGTTDVKAIVMTPSGFVAAGAVEAKASCWSMLKGGFTAHTSGPAELYFESTNSTSEIWVDNVSLQPFNHEEWRCHHDDTVRQERKMMVHIKAVDAKGKPVPGANVSVTPIRQGFPFGNAINGAILKSPEYQKWFADRFTHTTFENEMKWYGTEFTEGHEDYSVADNMLIFAKKNNVQVRGHNVFWNDPDSQMSWVNKLNNEQLQQAMTKRIKSVVSRYKGQVIHWDVNNENVHFNFFEKRLGPDASTKIYQAVHQIDPNVILFLNDFNTLEEPGDPNGTPDKFLKKFNEIKAGLPASAKMGIGLESHFKKPNLPYMRTVLDKMASAGVPIWLTEVDVGGTDAASAQDLEQILREGYAHPAVKGIVMWASWTPKGCYRMCLTDNNFKNHPVGDTVDKLIKEWKTHALGTTSKVGTFQTQLTHGDYEVKVNHLSGNLSTVHRITIDSMSHPELKVQIRH